MGEPGSSQGDKLWGSRDLPGQGVLGPPQLRAGTGGWLTQHFWNFLSQSNLGTGVRASKDEGHIRDDRTSPKAQPRPGLLPPLVPSASVPLVRWVTG